MLEVLGRRRGTGVLALLLCAAAWLGMAQAAQAGDLTRVGDTFVLTESDAVNIRSRAIARVNGSGAVSLHLMRITAVLRAPGSIDAARTRCRAARSEPFSRDPTRRPMTTTAAPDGMRGTCLSTRGMRRP